MRKRKIPGENAPTRHRGDLRNGFAKGAAMEGGGTTTTKQLVGGGRPTRIINKRCVKTESRTNNPLSSEKIEIGQLSKRANVNVAPDVSPVRKPI